MLVTSKLHEIVNGNLLVHFVDGLAMVFCHFFLIKRGPPIVMINFWLELVDRLIC